MKSVLFIVIALGFQPGAGAQGRYQVSGDGMEVVDGKTSLVWSRCAVGMEYKNNRCTGTVEPLTHQLAVLRAAQVNAATGKPWRLPTVKELLSIASLTLADVTASTAATDPKAFPDTPPIRFWTSTAAGPHYFLRVDFVDGTAGESTSSSPTAIRLVRDR